MDIVRSIENLPEFDDHELVAFIQDKATGLKAFIAIHDTALGPAAGGTRFWKYSSEREALKDVLNLSRAMTYKCALAGVPFGGGKAVIYEGQKTPALIRAYARLLKFFEKKFYTGEDVGISEKDVQEILKINKYVIGGPKASGDPSPWAALGVFYSMQAGLRFKNGSEDIRNRKFAVKGLGKVGLELCRLISLKGGKLYGADIDLLAIKKAKKLCPGITIISPLQIHALKVDVFSPCAMGADLNKKTIPELKCDLVCGGANNQLATKEDGKRLFRRNILYVPDYLANGGGLMNVVDELSPGGYNQNRVKNKIANIKRTVSLVLKRSAESNRPPGEIADELAESYFTKDKLRRKD